MENNEENLGSQEPVTNSTSSSPVKTTDYKKLIIVAIAIIAVIGLFLKIFTRSAKDTVKEYTKAYFNAKAKTVYNLVDEDGAAAFAKLSGTYNSDTEEYEYDFSKFDEYLKEVKDAKKDQSKEDKEKAKEAKEKTIESLQKRLDKLKDDKYKYKIKSIKTSSVKGTKKITKVEMKMQVTDEDGDKETDTYTFYTMKNGLKSYIVSPGF